MRNSLAVAEEMPAAESSIETIGTAEKALCLIIRANLSPAATTFLTPSGYNLQVGYVVHPAGHTIPRHVHLPVHRHLIGTSEVLVVRKGACELDIYSEDRVLVARRELAEGDVMVLVAGGHEFRMREDTVLLEIKQGPYPAGAEKERF